MKTSDDALGRESDALVLDLLYLLGVLALAGITALTARAAAKR